MQVVIRSYPHKKMNEYMEKYSHLRTKRTYIQPKNNARARTSFASASWQLHVAFCKALALESSKTQELLPSFLLS